MVWHAVIDPRTCDVCKNNNKAIFSSSVYRIGKQSLHLHCRCYTDYPGAIVAGTATQDGEKGVDWFLKYLHKLPDNYINKTKARLLGWIKEEGNLWSVAQGKTMGGDSYENRKSKLPSATDRIWYEADINYAGGFRSKQRVLYSSDGLVFVTYDHYETYFEIV